MKKVGTAIYTHSSDIGHFIMECANIDSEFTKKFTRACNIYNRVKDENHEVDVVKFDYKANTISFIFCPTFDILHEPIVEESYCINLTKDTWRIVKGGNKVYHRKWEFVRPNYRNFNYTEEMKRTAFVETHIPNIKHLKSKIGGKDYWYQLLKENNIEI